MTAVYFTTIPGEPNRANRQRESHFFACAKFVPALTTLFMKGLKFFELLCAIFDRGYGFRTLRIISKRSSRHLSHYSGLEILILLRRLSVSSGNPQG